MIEGQWKETQTDSEIREAVKEISELTGELLRETEKIVVGKTKQIELMIAALLAQGHVLIDDMPGVGKTTLIKTMSKALGFDFKRIQFTPDLLPSDVIGMNIFDRNTNGFRFVKGPVHTNILLADEINRAIPRTQSALLESMEERQVTIDGVSTPLPQPFFVLATQNPVESESTFQLPAAQMDRFLIRLSLGYPTRQEETQILNRMGAHIPYDEVQVVTSPEQFAAFQTEIGRIYASEEVADYIVRLVQETRMHPKLKHGASPRASLALLRMSKACAAMCGRCYVTPDDVKRCIQPVLAHRVVLNGSVKITGETVEQIIEDIADSIPVPPQKEQMIGG